MAPNPLTHFLCIPLATPASRPLLSRALSALRDDVSSANGLDLPAEVVRPPGTLHLTLGVMSFRRRRQCQKADGGGGQDANADDGDDDDDDDGGGGGGGGGGLGRAAEFLRSLKPREMLGRAVAATNPTAPRLKTPATTTATSSPSQTTTRVAAPSTTITTTATTSTTTNDGTKVTTTAGSRASFAITLRGLRAMGPSPASTSVLYAPPADDLGILQRFGESVRAAFLDAGLMVDDGRPLLLHATILNTAYAKGRARERGRAQKRGPGSRAGRNSGINPRPRNLKIDAMELLDRYDRQVWVEDLPMDRLAICKMGAKPLGTGEEDAEYEVEAMIEF